MAWTDEEYTGEIEKVSSSITALRADRDALPLWRLAARWKLGKQIEVQEDIWLDLVEARIAARWKREIG